jgi:hypothetical protein
VLRLAPLINELISPCQSIFIKKRSIHDNFLYVRNLMRRFHRTKTPAPLLKLDIPKLLTLSGGTTSAMLSLRTTVTFLPHGRRTPDLHRGRLLGPFSFFLRHSHNLLVLPFPSVSTSMAKLLSPLLLSFSTAFPRSRELEMQRR